MGHSAGGPGCGATPAGALWPVTRRVSWRGVVVGRAPGQCRVGHGGVGFRKEQPERKLTSAVTLSPPGTDRLTIASRSLVHTYHSASRLVHGNFPNVTPPPPCTYSAAALWTGAMFAFVYVLSTAARFEQSPYSIRTVELLHTEVRYSTAESRCAQQCRFLRRHWPGRRSRWRCATRADPLDER